MEAYHAARQQPKMYSKPTQEAYQKEKAEVSGDFSIAQKET